MHLSPTLGLLGLACIAISTLTVSATPVDVAARRFSSHQSLDRRSFAPNVVDSLVKRQFPGAADPATDDDPETNPPPKKHHWWHFWARDDAGLDGGVGGPSGDLVKRQFLPGVSFPATDDDPAANPPPKKEHWWHFWARGDAGLDGGDDMVRRAVPPSAATGAPAKGPWRQLSRRDEVDGEDGDAGEDGDDGEYSS
ncbi:hypothetical protein EIP91_006835 [Steccherinum ochraceum]|uniref:Uncharacterized protein n=1 Tax=Steccherinum ochraceum TaxID=92696 RepID=A0A4R0RAV5_9APHY|nr:hypothetical protein EIP91_006835 [Steccherinum ochraceum]